MNGFNLAYSVNNSSLPETQHFGNTIPYNDSVIVSFKLPVNMTKYGIYDIAVYGLNNKDDYTLNDTARVNIENINLDESFSLYPNPFKDQFTIYFKSPYSENVIISISNLTGSVLYSSERYISIGKNTITVDDVILKPALYYLNIRGSTINKTIPLLKVIR